MNEGDAREALREAFREARRKYGKNYPHTRCGQVLKAAFAALGIEVTVSQLRPLTLNPYVAEYARQGVLVCRHKTQFWAEPTGDQIAAWRRDGVQ